MIYPYKCNSGHTWEVIKSVKQIDNEEKCPDCGTIGERYISQSQSFSGADDWDTAHYSHALGKVVRNNKEERRLASAKGLIEVGNEKPEKIHKHFKKQRDDKQKASWDAVNMNHGNIRSK
jgi:ssDNA-binding Zn-finger/Zn-ribbon topoisomerase 1